MRHLQLSCLVEGRAAQVQFAEFHGRIIVSHKNYMEDLMLNDYDYQSCCFPVGVCHPSHVGTGTSVTSELATYCPEAYSAV